MNVIEGIWYFRYPTLPKNFLIALGLGDHSRPLEHTPGRKYQKLRPPSDAELVSEIRVLQYPKFIERFDQNVMNAIRKAIVRNNMLFRTAINAIKLQAQMELSCRNNRASDVSR